MEEGKIKTGEKKRGRREQKSQKSARARTHQVLQHNCLALGVVQEAAQEEAGEDQGGVLSILGAPPALLEGQELHAHLLRHCHSLHTSSFLHFAYGYAQEGELASKVAQWLCAVVTHARMVREGKYNTDKLAQRVGRGRGGGRSKKREDREAKKTRETREGGSLFQASSFHALVQE